MPVFRFYKNSETPFFYTNFLSDHPSNNYTVQLALLFKLLYVSLYFCMPRYEITYNVLIGIKFFIAFINIVDIFVVACVRPVVADS
jgi:hypothetical protein